MARKNGLFQTVEISTVFGKPFAHYYLVFTTLLASVVATCTKVIYLVVSEYNDTLAVVDFPFVY